MSKSALKRKNFSQTDNCLKKVLNRKNKKVITPFCTSKYLLYLCRFKSLSLSLSLSLSNKLCDTPKFNMLKILKYFKELKDLKELKDNIAASN